MDLDLHEKLNIPVIPVTLIVFIEVLSGWDRSELNLREPEQDIFD